MAKEIAHFFLPGKKKASLRGRQGGTLWRQATRSSFLSMAKMKSALSRQMPASTAQI